MTYSTWWHSGSRRDLQESEDCLASGADVVMTMGDPNVWVTSDLDQISGVYGAFIVERPSKTNTNQALDL
jgi:hypothetical protein